VMDIEAGNNHHAPASTKPHFNPSGVLCQFLPPWLCN